MCQIFHPKGELLAGKVLRANRVHRAHQVFLDNMEKQGNQVNRVSMEPVEEDCWVERMGLDT
jgi:hypothetical protein